MPLFALHMKSSMILVGISLTPLYPGYLQVFEDIQNTSPTSMSMPVSSITSLLTASITFSPTSTCPPGNTHPPRCVFTIKISSFSLITIPAAAIICVGITHVVLFILNSPMFQLQTGICRSYPIINSLRNCDRSGNLSWENSTAEPIALTYPVSRRGASFPSA